MGLLLAPAVGAFIVSEADVPRGRDLGAQLPIPERPRPRCPLAWFRVAKHPLDARSRPRRLRRKAKDGAPKEPARPGRVERAARASRQRASQPRTPGMRPRGVGTVALDRLDEMLTSEQVRSRGPICFSGAPFFHLEATISMAAASRLGATRLERTRSRHERHHRTTVRAGLEARGGASDEAIGRASATLPTGAFDHLPAVRLPPRLHETANPLEVALAAAIEP
jgi:hypothetical protein